MRDKDPCFFSVVKEIQVQDGVMELVCYYKGWSVVRIFHPSPSLQPLPEDWVLLNFELRNLTQWRDGKLFMIHGLQEHPEFIVSSPSRCDDLTPPIVAATKGLA